VGHGGLLRGKRSALARPAETERAGAGPGDGVAFLIRDGHDRVVERGLHMHDTRMDDALFLLLETLLLACFDWCFRHTLCLTRRLFLVCHGAAARSFASARIRVGALSPHRQTAAMAEPAVRPHLDVTFDVHRDLFA